MELRFCCVDLICTRFHSFADASPFVAVSLVVWFRSSKTRVFLAVQMAQQIQGSILPLIPVGGRQNA
ncbi:unnamed protein product, partial [Brassica oleracea]